MGQRILILSKHFFVDYFGPGDKPAHEIIKDGLPADTEITNVMLGLPHNDLIIKLQSACWDGPQDGEQIPHLDLQFKRHYKPKDSYGILVSDDVAKQLGKFYAEISKPKDESAGEPPVRFREWT